MRITKVAQILGLALILFGIIVSTSDWKWIFWVLGVYSLYYSEFNYVGTNFVLWIGFLLVLFGIAFSHFGTNPEYARETEESREVNEEKKPE